jgi:uncharacterized membrane protein
MNLNASGILDLVFASSLVLSVFPASLNGVGGMVSVMSQLAEELKIYFVI